MTSLSGVLCNNDTDSKPWKMQKLQSGFGCDAPGRSRDVTEPQASVAHAHLLIPKCPMSGITSFNFRNAFMIVTTKDQTLELRTQHNNKLTDMNERRRMA
jgi:hypothetical protein